MLLILAQLAKAGKTDRTALSHVVTHMRGGFRTLHARPVAMSLCCYTAHRTLLSANGVHHERLR